MKITFVLILSSNVSRSLHVSLSGRAAFELETRTFLRRSSLWAVAAQLVPTLQGNSYSRRLHRCKTSPQVSASQVRWREAKPLIKPGGTVVEWNGSCWTYTEIYCWCNEILTMPKIQDSLYYYCLIYHSY